MTFYKLVHKRKKPKCPHYDSKVIGCMWLLGHVEWHNSRMSTLARAQIPDTISVIMPTLPSRCKHPSQQFLKREVGPSN
jgi:hypothetical protein